jgi:hypothetical protein
MHGKYVRCNEYLATSFGSLTIARELRPSFEEQHRFRLAMPANLRPKSANDNPGTVRENCSCKEMCVPLGCTNLV